MFEDLEEEHQRVESLDRGSYKVAQLGPVVETQKQHVGVVGGSVSHRSKMSVLCL